MESRIYPDILPSNNLEWIYCSHFVSLLHYWHNLCLNYCITILQNQRSCIYTKNIFEYKYLLYLVISVFWRQINIIFCTPMPRSYGNTVKHTRTSALINFMINQLYQVKQEALDCWTFYEFGSLQQKLFLKLTSFIKLVLQKIENMLNRWRVRTWMRICQ